MKKYKKWSREELDFILNNCQKIKDKDLAVLLSEKFNTAITVDMLRRQRRKLELKKNRGRPRKCKEVLSEDDNAIV